MMTRCACLSGMTWQCCARRYGKTLHSGCNVEHDTLGLVHVLQDLLQVHHYPTMYSAAGPGLRKR